MSVVVLRRASRPGSLSARVASPGAVVAGVADSVLASDLRSQPWWSPPESPLAQGSSRWSWPPLTGVRAGVGDAVAVAVGADAVGEDVSDGVGVTVASVSGIEAGVGDGVAVGVDAGAAGGAVVAAVAVSWGVAPGRSGASGVVVAAAGSAPGVVGGGARGSSPPHETAANTPAATSSTHQGFSPFMGPA